MTAFQMNKKIDALREKGKALYESGDYDRALYTYDSVLSRQDLDSRTRAMFHSNRAQCHLKKHNYKAALEESTSALNLIPNDQKSLYRRCLAYENLGRLDDALKDASGLDPCSLRKKIRARLKRIKEVNTNRTSQQKISTDESASDPDVRNDYTGLNQTAEMYKKNDPVKIRNLLDECQRYVNEENCVDAIRCAHDVFKGLEFLYATKFGDRNFLASSFKTCTVIFKLTGEHFYALRSYYRRIAFEVQWNPQENHRLMADPLLKHVLDASIGRKEDLLYTLQDLDELSASFEKLQFWPAWIQIAIDLFFLHEEAVARRLLDFSFDIFLSCSLRRGRGLLQLKDFHGVKRLCKTVVKEKYDCMEAYEIWAKSLKNEGKIEQAMKKADLALEFCKNELEKRRIKQLIHRIETVDISSDITEDSRDWIRDTNALRHEEEMKRMRSMTSHRKSTKHRRPKRKAKMEDFISAGGRLTGSFSTNLNVPKYISKISEDARIKQTAQFEAVHIPENSHSCPVIQTPEEMSDSDQESIQSAISIEEEQEVPCAENFYEKSVHLADESRAIDDNYLNKLLRSGIQLTPRFVDKFRKKRKNRTQYYDNELNPSELENRVKMNGIKYKKCKIKIQSAHLANCKPLDTMDPIKTITISGRQKAGQARNDDEVVVELIDEKDKSTSERRRYGKVLGTLKRSRNENVDHPLFLCAIDPNESHLVIPLCKTVPKIRLSTDKLKRKYGNIKQCQIEKYCYDRDRQEIKFDKFIDVTPDSRKCTLYIVVFITWNLYDVYPSGAVIDVLTSKGDIDCSLRILDIKHNVQTTYLPETVQETKTIMNKFSTTEAPRDYMCGRQRLSDVKVFTIDPPGSHDLDDALSVDYSDDVFKVGVHIADVSVYVPKGSPIDVEAQRRTTSFFSGLQKSARHMIPEPLSIDLCSLLPGKERPCLSVFFKFNKDWNQIEKPNIVKTIVCSNKQMTYQNVQDIIESGKSDDEDMSHAIQNLLLLAQKLRKERLHDAMYSFPVESNSSRNVRDERKAHFLVEELMILTNKTICGLLMKTFHKFVPLRRQREPNNEEITQWLDKEKDIVDIVLALQGKRINKERVPSFRNVSKCSKKFVTIQDWVWKVLTIEDDNEQEFSLVQKYMQTDEIHPMQCLTYLEWNSHQENAEYVCSGMVANSENGRHFSLDYYPYTQFTSPIRRYSDLITHRLVHCMIEGKDSPYQQNEVDELCIRINTVQQRQKAYQKKCEMLKLSLQLRKKPKMFNCFIHDVSENCISLTIPSMKSFESEHSNTIVVGLLDPYKNPKIIKDSKFPYDLVCIEWRKRLYNAYGYSSCIAQRKYREKTQPTQRVDPNRHGVSIPVSKWSQALQFVLEERKDELKSVFKNIAPDGIKLPTSVETVRDVSTETHDGTVQPFTSFSITLTRGQIVKVQMAADMQSGLLCPYPQLLYFTENIQFCLQHMKDPVECLTQYATKCIRQKYNSVKEYNTTWLSLLQMESALKSVRNENNFTIHNVFVKFKSGTGQFRLPISFCHKRSINLATSENYSDGTENQSDDREVDVLGANGWLCVRSELTQLSDDNDKPSFWVAHGEITSVEKKKDKHKLTVSFNVHEMSHPVPRDINREHCTVEFLIKADFHRRMERCLKSLEKTNETVAFKIAMFVKMPQLDEDYLNLATTIDPEVDVADCLEVTRTLPKNNEKQRAAIKNSLTSTFSLIHGPPGTGKSYTGIKLLYLFSEINKKHARTTGVKRQIIFCGPSNKSVDLVANLSRERLGSKCPKMIRIYGETIENIDFPNNGRVLLSKKSLRDTKSDEKLKDISLHYLIRQEGNTHASDLKAFDRKFKRKDYTSTLEELNEYQALRYKARKEELNKCEVIFCTTAVATSRILHDCTNIFQLVIDEAGMCTEPECLAPIISTGPKQVVLIGDHMQLQPIISSKHAAELGMSRSLFERYATASRTELAKNNIKYTFLDTQYRMNPGLCEFPSKKFYESKLITEENNDRVLWKQGRALSVWFDKFRPHILCHVEGEETALNASTEEGNEQSRSNLKEIEKVVEVFRHLIRGERVDSKKIVILSQYNAQCSKLRDQLEKNYFFKINVSTVVSSQGGEWDYVIFSTVRSLPAHMIEKNPTLGWCKQNLGFITDTHQINVALTRARKGIIIIGNMNLLRCDKVWEELIEHYRKHKCIRYAETFPSEDPRNQRRHHFQMFQHRN